MNKRSDTPFAVPVTAVPGIRFPAIHQGRRATIMALVAQMQESEYWASERMAAHQMDQLGVLIAHAAKSSPFYARRFDEAGFAPDQPLTPERIETLPPLTRRQLQESLDEIRGDAPKSHGPVTEITTSGSTGFPLKLSDTGISGLLWSAITLRDHLWHRRDFTASLAAIRSRGDRTAMAPQGIERENWGEPVSLFYRTGPGYMLNSASDVGAQADWLQRCDPAYLISHPSNIAALAARFIDGDRALSRLREVRSVGETVTTTVRAACRRAWDVDLTDFYTCEEAGYLALQCPTGAHYHVQSEHVYLEVVNRENRRCRPGEIGRILVTSLHNFATPLIRYEIGDYGEMGTPCDCGRTLPVLTRVLGRVRNMLHLPGGEQRWPDIGFSAFSKLADIRQFQVVQRTLKEIEFRVCTPNRFGPEVEEALRRVLVEHLGHPFRVEITYHRRLERARSGNFEDFVSMVQKNGARAH